jgi:DNA topoisomerase-3
MTTAVLAEKPSVARDLADVLGARARGDGCLRGNGYVVTWAIGHLVTLAEPSQYDERWKAWRFADLPMVPREWRLVVAEATKDQFSHVRRVLLDPEVSRVICATDAGREGELIFRYVYEAAHCKKPVSRLWISSLTPEAIAKGFRELEDGKKFDPLARAAQGRSRADWLVGMNLSRAYSLAHDALFSVGRVQTPTLAMVVARELEIRAFVPEDYFEVAATFRRDESDPPDPRDPRDPKSYLGTWFRGDSRRLPADGEEARAIAERVLSGEATIDTITREDHKLPPPLLYDLTELQRHANRLYGMSAQRTLDVAQVLYERKKLLSYPRTDSRRLSRDIAATLPDVVAAISGPYQGKLAPGTGERPLSSRFVDDAKVTDHHAILPTTTRARAGASEGLTRDEERIYDLVCRRLLAAWHEDHRYATTRVVTRVRSPAEVVDLFASSGTSIERIGWKVLDIGEGKRDAPLLPGGLAKEDSVTVVSAAPQAKQTRPPLAFTDATLLTAMETAGRVLVDKELKDAMRDRGLGTPATRAAMLETLLRREYIVRDGKWLKATDTGIELVESVHANVKSPAMTGEWEAKLARIEEGAGDLETFMQEIEEYVGEVVKSVGVPEGRSERTLAAPARAGAPAPETSLAKGERPAPKPLLEGRSSRPTGAEALPILLRESFGFASFRPYQEAVCQAATAGRDVLLVMPTGAGKSLCYQLPGLARGGTTLVISPLIALIEDQVQKLLAYGFAAERIHSGRERTSSRAACRAYLDGKLDFLFVAPERLKVPGFPEMLARRPPTLVAIDEAHCISQWGHDFRPEYRMLGERLPLLRPAPFVALTATATPAVQDDIVSQLRLEGASRFIHGFRRTNIVVEVVEKTPGDRAEAVLALLSDEQHRPAIVYAPSRAETETLAGELSAKMRATPYHAGMTASARERAQRSFLEGSVDVVVATIAFGMGIDKPNIRTVVHTALPGSVESYYQEIGRAGRDGASSRAILFHSFVDMRTHEFFHERSYPKVAVLEAVYAKLRDEPMDKELLMARVDMNPDVFEKALEKLWLHGGARVEPDQSLVRGDPKFSLSYAKQIEFRLEQIAKMQRFAQKNVCRMLQLVRHFGDENDSGAPCGACDVCAPEGAVAKQYRTPSASEGLAAQKILSALTAKDGQTTGQLHRDLFREGELDRRSLEHIVGGLARARLVTLTDDSFVKEGVTIPFQRAHLTALGRADLRSHAPSFAMDRASAHGKKGSQRKRKPRKERAVIPDTPESEALFQALRAWRHAEAGKMRVPAFRILSDRTLRQVAHLKPDDEGTLLSVSGIGPGIAQRYGGALLEIVSRFASR